MACAGLVIAWAVAAPPVRHRRVSVSGAAAAAPEMPLATAPPVTASPARIPSQVPRDPQAGRWAVVIGADAGGSSPVVGGGRHDAIMTYKALMGYGFRPDHVRMLLDGQATGQAILSAASWLAEVSEPGGVAVFALAGHGRADGESYVVAGDGAHVRAGQLAARLSRVRGRMWASFATCYSGGFLVPGITGPGRVVTSASGPAENAYEASDVGGSYYVYELVVRSMLAGMAPESVQAAFARATRILTPQRGDGTPMMSDQAGGALVLGTMTPQQIPVPALDAVPPPGPRWTGETVVVTTPEPTPAPTRRGIVPACNGLRCD